MKKIFLILFFLSAFPFFAQASEACEVDYLNFCSFQDPRIHNMCPEILGDHLKATCIVTKTQKKVILSECSNALKQVCRVAKGDDFLSQYVCLTNPENWGKFSETCLKSLVKGNPHH
jgi:hypothetical protein